RAGIGNRVGFDHGAAGDVDRAEVGVVGGRRRGVAVGNRRRVAFDGYRGRGRRAIAQPDRDGVAQAVGRRQVLFAVAVEIAHHHGYRVRSHADFSRAAEVASTIAQPNRDGAAGVSRRQVLFAVAVE